jgi:hypothetical protein
MCPLFLRSACPASHHRSVATRSGSARVPRTMHTLPGADSTAAQTACTIVTGAGGGVVQLSVSNDAAAGPAAGGGNSHGLSNLAGQVQAARRPAHQPPGRWPVRTDRTKIPLPATGQDGDGEPVAGGSSLGVPAG